MFTDPFAEFWPRALGDDDRGRPLLGATVRANAERTHTHTPLLQLTKC